MSTVTVVFNISFCVLTICTCCTSITFSTCCTIFNDSCSGITVTIFDGYSVSTVAVVFNISFSILTVCTCCTSITFLTFSTSCTSITFRTSCTIFHDSGCSVTVAIFDGYSVSTVAVVFNVCFSVLTVCTSRTIFTVFTIFNDSSGHRAST